MSDTTTLQDHGERIARPEQIADDTRRALDRIEANLGKLDTGLNQRIDRLDSSLTGRIDRVDQRIDSLTKWFVGLLFTLALATAGGFAALYQVIARLQLPHG